MLKVDVITAYCGESQFLKCSEMVREQKNVLVNHVIIENQDFLNSQLSTFKKAIESNADYICKLDADMVLPDEYYIYDLLNFFSNNIERITIKVDDFYSGQKIWGFHILKASALNPSLQCHIALPQPDIWINKIERAKYIKRYDRYIKHGYNPTDEQCFRYGFSRGRKLINSAGINVINTYINILNAKKSNILAGYVEGIGCNSIEDIDSIDKLFCYLKLNMFQKIIFKLYFMFK